MTNKTNMKPVAAIVGAALVGSLAALNVAAGENPFGATQLDSGYMQLAGNEAGEGKCGDDMGKKEGKCGEGKCGDDKGKMEGKCGDDKGKMEGKCGDDKDKKEGKCGEGKCGGDKG